MQPVTIKLSSKGQLTIPKTIMEELHWDAGIQLTLVSIGNGIMLQAQPKPEKRNLADLKGMLHYEGPLISLETLCKPVELTEEESAEYRR